MTAVDPAVMVDGMPSTTPTGPLLVQDLSFTSGGARCAATLSLPATEGPHPGALIVHGFACDRHMRLEPYVTTLTERGVAVLTMDPRHVGQSEGMPRDLVDPERLVEDALAALALLREQPQVTDEVALIGFSFGGGVALEAAARDGRLSALVHVVGFVAPRSRPDPELLELFTLAEADLAAAAAGEPPVTLPICAPPAHAALISSADALAGKDLLDEAGVHPNATPARCLLGLAGFAPGEAAAGLTCPTYFYVCRTDMAVDVDATLTLAAALPHALTQVYDGSHFDVFRPDTARSVAADIAVFLASVNERTA